MASSSRKQLFSMVLFSLVVSLQPGPAFSEPQDSTDTPVAAPITTTSAGTAGSLAFQSVVRVQCPATGKGGTGFLHKTGRIITVEHLVSDCSELVVLPPSGDAVNVTARVVDTDLDLAVLTLSKKLTSPALPLSSSPTISIGAQVTTWGFPGGYRGRTPLLSVGYLAGLETVKAKSGKQTTRWVVNAAFNLGNSGGPLIDIEDGTVVGVVLSKLTPMPDFVEQGIQALDDLTVGVKFTVTQPDGTTEEITQGRVIAEVMNHLRSQVQLVIGKAVRIGDLRQFMKQNGIEP